MQLAFCSAAWRPEDFWHAAPVEVLALAPEPASQPLTRARLAELQSFFPDEPR